MAHSAMSLNRITWRCFSGMGDTPGTDFGPVMVPSMQMSRIMDRSGTLSVSHSWEGCAPVLQEAHDLDGNRQKSLQKGDRFVQPKRSRPKNGRSSALKRANESCTYELRPSLPSLLAPSRG